MKKRNDIYLSEIDPAEYFRRQKAIRIERVKEAFGYAALLALATFAVWAWFAIEGFSVKW